MSNRLGHWLVRLTAPASHRRCMLPRAHCVRTLAVMAALATLTACTINPVTGQRELALVSAADEVSIGEAQYLPTRQSQGGDYVADPALARYVAGVGQRVAAVSERGLPYEFVVLNSSVPNAWALPGGKIAINRGLLLELETEAELAAVLGHEVVHAAARHGAQAMQRGMLLQGAVLAAAVGADQREYSNVIVGAASLGAQLINQRHGRGAELESDFHGMRYMAEAGYDPTAAIALQETFVRLSGGSSPGWLDGLFASHPPSVERVEQNRQTAAGLPPGGELGRERYQAAIAGLVASRPAYDAYDEGRRALVEGRPDDAARLANRAIELFPAEGHFHALAGDVAYAQGRFEEAVRRFDAAIARNADFFYYPLRKGFAQQNLSQWEASERALTRSVEILPTAEAFYGLGLSAERRGDSAAALERYALAAQSESDAGRAARDATVRLDLPRNPGNYFEVRSGLDDRGMLLVEIGNPTGVAVADIVIVVRYPGSDGRTVQSTRNVGRLAAGAGQRVATGLGPFASANAYQVGVQSAVIASD